MLNRLGVGRKFSLPNSRQSVYANLFVGFSFFCFSFLTFTMLSPIVSSNAEKIIVTDGVNYTASLSTDNLTQIAVIPTNEQTVFSGNSSIKYSNSCPYGFNVSMSSSTSNTGLTRTGDDSGSKTIKSVSTSGPLEDNSWGYSLDDGETYNPIPSPTSPVTLVNTIDEITTETTKNVKYGIKLNSDIPSGSYSSDIVYTVAVKPRCITYDLKWNLNGGTGASGVSYADKTINYGNTINLQTYKPTREGYTFEGWTTSAGYTFGSTIGEIDVNPSNANGVTLTAKWELENYGIEYTLNGGSVSPANPDKYNINTATFTLTNPTRTGYTFDGWTGSNGTTKQTTVTITKGSKGKKAYIANWTPIKYTISYTMDGGACSSYTNNYTIETNTFSLCTPTRTGYTFAGWTGSNGTTAQTSVSIAKGSYGNKSYTANWTINSYLVTVTNGTFSDGTKSKYFNYNTTATATASGLPSCSNYSSWATYSTDTQYRYKTCYKWSGDTQKSITVTGNATISFSYTSYSSGTQYRYAQKFYSDGSLYSTVWTDETGFFQAPNGPSKTGYTCRTWKDRSSGSLYTATATYTRTVPASYDVSCTANNYTITVNNGTGGGTYAYGSTATIKATVPASSTSGYKYKSGNVAASYVDCSSSYVGWQRYQTTTSYSFSRWSGASTSTSSQLSFTVTGNATYTANFNSSSTDVNTTTCRKNSIASVRFEAQDLTDGSSTKTYQLGTMSDGSTATAGESGNIIVSLSGNTFTASRSNATLTHNHQYRICTASYGCSQYKSVSKGTKDWSFSWTVSSFTPYSWQ